MLVGVGELMSRYRDAPFLSLKTWGSALYLAVNGIAALTALLLLDTFGQTLLTSYDPFQKAMARVLIAGFGAIAFLRSSLFRVRIDQTEVGIGPSAILDILLGVADRDIDRSRALDRADRVPEIMATIPANIACIELPALCLALMQNLSADEQRVLGDQMRLINEDKVLSEVGKTVNAGLLLTRFVGYGVLERAVKSIHERPRGSLGTQEVTQLHLEEIKRDLAIDLNNAGRGT